MIIRLKHCIARRGRTAQVQKRREREFNYSEPPPTHYTLHSNGDNYLQPLALPQSLTNHNEASQIPVLAMSPSTVYHPAQTATSSSTRLHHISLSTSRPTSHPPPYPIPLLNPPQLLLPTSLASEKRRPLLANTKCPNPSPSSTPSSRLCHKTQLPHHLIQRRPQTFNFRLSRQYWVSQTC